MKQKSDIGFSTLHNVDTKSVSDVETTLKQHWCNFIRGCKSYIKISRASDKYGFVNR